VQVLHEEGVANHLGPEPCVGTREDDGEASAGERTGQPLSRETREIPGADAFQIAEGGTRARECECPDDPAWSETLACADALCSGTGRSRVSANDAKRCWSAAGRRGAVDGRLGDQLWFGLVSTGASDSVSTGVRDGAMARVEVITGRERRRWSAEQKRALAVESLRQAR
jgi:hypothetical protein